MREIRGSLFRAALVASLLLGVAVAAHAQDRTPKPESEQGLTIDDGRWHVLVGMYGWFPSLSGTVSVRDYVQVPIDVPFSDLWSHLKAVVPAHFEARRDRFGLGTDLLYIRLGVPIQGNIPEYLGASLDFRSWIVEGFGFYRVAQGHGENPWIVDLVGGVRYWNVNTRVDASAGSTNPLTTDWVDGFGGVRLQLPIVGCLSLLERGDVGAGGAKLDWSASGDLSYRLGKGWVSGLGYKYLSVDYGKQGALGIDRRVVDVAFSGPRAWIAYTW